MKCSLRLGSALWSLDGTAWNDEVIGDHVHCPLASKDNSQSTKQKPKANVVIKEKVYTLFHGKSASAWFERLQQERICPNADQLAYLYDIRDRCLIEAKELSMHAGTATQVHMSEPYRKNLLGPPGIGKSECLRWTRRFFEEVLGWTHGVQFQMVAPQHTMALLIGGATVHSFGQVPINVTTMQERGGKKSEQ